MAKFLKKKIKNTLPIIVIFCLLNAIVLGLSFNLNLNFVQPVQKGFVDMAPQAEAAANATTSVIVANAPPNWLVTPAENPTSASTTPVNVGGSIGFTGEAVTSQPGDSYWMIICSGGKATSSANWVAPTCVGGTKFCVSNLASTSISVSCTYNNVADPGSESQAWYAYACDNHYGNPQCTVVGNQGTGNSGSPFYINHAPHLNHLYTSVDNKDPNQVVTITASTTDTDHISGTYNTQSLFVCSTNVWTVNGGCGGTELCHGSSSVPITASSSVSCLYTVPIPKMHGAYPYYGFIKDQHEMAATSTRGQGSTANYNVNNVAPTITNVALNSGNSITLNISGAPQVTVYASSTSVTDANGCTDLSSATSTIYLSSVTNGRNCTANNNYCYQIANSNCSIYNCSGPSSVSATVKCSTTLAFYTMPTDSSSYASTSHWMAAIKVSDGPGLKGVGTSTAAVSVNSNAALNLEQNAIAYGTIPANSNTGSLNQTTAVDNFGNTPIDTAVQGLDMLKNGVGPEKVQSTYQQDSITPFTYGSGNPLASSSSNTLALGIARPNSGSLLSSNIYWGIGIPFGTLAVTFKGVNTFTVVLNKHDNWQYAP